MAYVKVILCLVKTQKCVEHKIKIILRRLVMIEKLFKLKENNTTVNTEVTAGITTFMTMAYILIVNPQILSATGMDAGAVFTATAIAAFIGTMAMALLANYPIVLASGMGINAYFAFTVAMEYGWELALLAVFVEGIIFLLLTASNVREAIFNCIPMNIKHAITVGIGLFIAFVGFQSVGIIVVNDATIVGLGDLTSIPVILSLIGVIITSVLLAKNVKGAMLVGIVSTYLIGVALELVGIYVVDPSIGMYSLIPSGIIQAPPSMAPASLFTAYKNIDFSAIKIINFITIVIAFLVVDLFDTVGTLIGIATKAEYLDENGKMPRLKQALFADAIGTTAGALCGTSTVTSYVESTAGVAAGGRTGLTGVVAACLFLVSLLFFPIISVIPAFATAPALIIVGVFMLDAVKKINFDDYTESIPAFLVIILMPLTYSISNGLMFGIISYVCIKVLSGKKEDLNIPLICVAIFFIIALFS